MLEDTNSLDAAQVCVLKTDQILESLQIIRQNLSYSVIDSGIAEYTFYVDFRSSYTQLQHQQPLQGKGLPAQ